MAGMSRTGRKHRAAAAAGISALAAALLFLTPARAAMAVTVAQAPCVASGQAEDDEVRRGPYPVPPAKWVKAIALAKGQEFRVSVTGYLKYKEHPFTEFGANGNYWGWHSLKGRIGSAVIALGGAGSGVAPAAGTLELGAPHKDKLGEGEEAGLDPSYSFCVTVYVGPVPTSSAPTKKPLSTEVSLASVSNGCGGGVAGTNPRFGDTSVYWAIDPNKPGRLGSAFVVNFREACNFHDACYSGAVVKDPFTGRVVDHRPWSQKQCDDRFFTYMRLLCLRQIKAKAQERGFTLSLTRAITNCYSTGESLGSDPSLGAESRYDFVRSQGAAFYRRRADLNGTWVRFTGRPVVLIVKQIGRSITATWVDANSHACGKYRGVLITRDQDEIVEPTTTLDGHAAVFTIEPSGKRPERDVIEWRGPSGRATLQKTASKLVSGCT